jgi:peptidyl-prolyl cis-trans isomerase SurA
VIRLTVIILAICIASAACAQELVDRIVAVVDKDPIFMSDVEAALVEDLYLRSMKGEAVPQDSAQIEAIKLDIIETLIDRRIVIAKAREVGVEVTRTEIEDALDQWLEDMINATGSEAALMAELERESLTLKDFKARSRKDIEEQLLVNRFMRQQFTAVDVSENDILSFYETKYDSIPDLPEMLGLAHIIIVPRISPEREAAAVGKIENIVERIEAGEAFETVAMELSEDGLTRANGGLIGLVSLDDLQGEIAEVAGSLEPGEISDPVRTRYGLQIIKLDAKEQDRYKLRHILVGLYPSREDTLAAAARAYEVKERLDAGDSFEALAREYSDDEKTRESGGYVGEMEIGALDNTYRSNLAGLEAGEVSGVVRTRHGFQILKVVARTASRKATFDEAREWIRNVVEARKREQLFAEWLEDAREDIYVKRYEF